MLSAAPACVLVLLYALVSTSANAQNVTNVTTVAPVTTVVAPQAPTAVASSTRINASVIANVNSSPVQRRISITLANAAWNTTWCLRSPALQLQSSSAGTKPCGLVRNANRTVGVGAIACTSSVLTLTLMAWAGFALPGLNNEVVTYEFMGPYLILPQGAVAAGVNASLAAFPLTIVADQPSNVTCADPNAVTTTPAPPPGGDDDRPAVMVLGSMFINATTMANVSSKPADRRIELQVANAQLNTTWCATASAAGAVNFYRNESPDAGAIPQPCGFLANRRLAIGVGSIVCPSPQRLILTFLPFAAFALTGGQDQILEYAFTGNYLMPSEGTTNGSSLLQLPPLPVQFVADQPSGIVCDQSALSSQPPSTNATFIEPPLPWPSTFDASVWTAVATVAGLASIFAGSTAGANHVVWVQRMTFLSSHNCNWQNLTEVPVHNNPLTITLDDLPYWSDFESRKFIPFISCVLVSLGACILIGLVQLAMSAILGMQRNGITHGMAQARFPSALTFPAWSFCCLPVVSAAVTIFTKSGNAPELDPMIPGLAGVGLLVFAAVIAANGVIVIAQLRARAVDRSADDQGTQHKLVTASALWGDRLGFEGYTERFGALFWQYSSRRHWFFFVELALATVQAGLAGYRADYPDCQSATFTPLAVSAVVDLFAIGVLDPYVTRSDTFAACFFNVVLFGASIVAAYVHSDLPEWATRTDQIAAGAVGLSAAYALGMAGLMVYRWRSGVATTAEPATEAEERRLAAMAGMRRVGAEGEPGEAEVYEPTPEELEELRRLAEEEARLTKTPALDPSVLAEPDPELREVLKRGNWARMETENGPYYYNRHTGKSVWDLRDEIGLPPLYGARFRVNDLSDDDEDEELKKNPLTRRLLLRGSGSDPSSNPQPYHDPVADALAKRVWVAYPDPASGRTYYANTTTNETTWDLEERLGAKDAAQKARELEERKKRGLDPLEEVLAQGHWVRVEPEGGGKPYYYHAATRKTVWNLKKELGIVDPPDLNAAPPAAPVIADKADVSALDIEMIANLMAPEVPTAKLPSMAPTEAKLWWLPQTADDLSAAVATSSDDPVARSIFDPASPILRRPGDASAIASPALLRLLAEQQQLPSRRDDAVSMAIAHALATREWVELPPTSPGGRPAFINPVTKEIVDDLHEVYSTQSLAARDPVEAALASKEWLKVTDPVSRLPFYVHVLSRRTTWDLRTELLAAKSRERTGLGAADRTGGVEGDEDESAKPRPPQQVTLPPGEPPAGTRKNHRHNGKVTRRRTPVGPPKETESDTSSGDVDTSREEQAPGGDRSSPMRRPRALRPRPDASPLRPEAAGRQRFTEYGSGAYYEDLWNSL
jgi:hypothetical protein